MLQKLLIKAECVKTMAHVKSPKLLERPKADTLQHSSKGQVQMPEKLSDATMGNQQPSVVGNNCEGSTTIEMSEGQMSMWDKVDIYSEQSDMWIGDKENFLLNDIV